MGDIQATEGLTCSIRRDVVGPAAGIDFLDSRQGCHLRSRISIPPDMANDAERELHHRQNANQTKEPLELVRTESAGRVEPK